MRRLDVIESVFDVGCYSHGRAMETFREQQKIDRGGGVVSKSFALTSSATGTTGSTRSR
ncbi:hypothetical protein [Actinomadura napierensis]|uniref:hypothetical protein n=1 Tax=Actinomadura napierensis TaxID=267854 RepID=UPI0031DB5931